MKGIVLAGGTGSRLFPLTATVNKQMLPVYDKPLIYYPISTLMLAGIRDIMIIARSVDLPPIKNLLGDGSDFGIRLCYAVQEQPNGIAEAFLVAQKFISGHNVALILGDNIFFGHNFRNVLIKAGRAMKGARIFSYYVPDPRAFGIVEFDHHGKALTLEEKPANPRSHYAVVGLYFYDAQVLKIARGLTPSARGELEITDVNLVYLEKEELGVIRLERGFAWLDAGTPDALLEAANYIATIERRQGLKIGCIEEIAWRQKWINSQKLAGHAKRWAKSDYGKYLSALL